MMEREAEAERRLVELGIVGVRVEGCGHEAAIAALAVPAPRWAEVMERGDEVARAVRAAGFRFVTLDLGDDPEGG